MKIHLMILVCALALAGCSLPQYKDNAKYHQLPADKHGDYLSLYGNNDHFQCGLNQHLTKIVDRLKEHPIDSATNKRKVLISIHGGLNTLNSNVSRVKKHYKDAIEDGYYPIFISWRSGALTTLNDRYFHIRNGVNSSRWQTVPSSPLYMISDLLRGVGSIPEAFWDQGKNFTSTHYSRISDFDENNIAYQQKDYGEELDIYYTGRGNEKDLLDRVGYAARQVVPGVARLISTPLIEGVANESWEVMLRRAKTLMYRQGDLSYRGVGRDYSNKNKNPVPDVCEAATPYFKEKSPNGVVAQLMRALQTLDDSVDITLVGHSMGAIIANDIVDEFDGLYFSTIVHMASADSIRNLMNKTIPYLEKNEKGTQFYNLMLHPTNEEQEQSVSGIAPEGSLLIWLDDMLTNPETRLDRRSGRWDNIKWAFPLFETNHNMHFKLFGVRHDYSYSANYSTPTNKDAEGLSEPITHGGFGDFKFWRDEFYWGKP